MMILMLHGTLTVTGESTYHNHLRGERERRGGAWLVTISMVLQVDRQHMNGAEYLRPTKPTRARGMRPSMALARRCRSPHNAVTWLCIKNLQLDPTWVKWTPTLYDLVQTRRRTNVEHAPWICRERKEIYTPEPQGKGDKSSHGHSPRRWRSVESPENSHVGDKIRLFRPRRGGSGEDGVRSEDEMRMEWGWGEDGVRMGWG